MKGGIHSGLYGPNAGIIALHFPFTTLPSIQPTRQNRVLGQNLRQGFPQRVQIKGLEPVILVLVVEYNVQSVAPHATVQR